MMPDENLDPNKEKKNNENVTIWGDIWNIFYFKKSLSQVKKSL